MTRPHGRTAIAAAIALSLYAGCSSSPTVRVGSAAVAFDDVIARADQQTADLHSLQGEGNLQIESPDFSQSATFEVVLLRPDSLQLLFKGPFGITVAQALVTRETFQLYNSLQNRLYTGVTSPENLEKTVRIGLSFDEILSLFTGGTVLTTDRSASYTSSADGADAAFVFVHHPYQHRYVVDPATKHIRKFQLLNERGAPIGEQSFSSFETIDGITYPRKITITQHAERRRLTIYYQSIEWNTAGPSSFSFIVPSNAERIDLE